MMTVFVGFGIVLRFSSHYDTVLKVSLRDKKVFVVDWIPMLVLMPFATVLAFEANMVGFAVIYSIHWIGTLRLMRRLYAWKEVNM